jgi:hypothetical protein
MSDPQKRAGHASGPPRLAAALAIVALLGAMLPMPVARADIGDTVACAVSSFGLKKLVTTLFRVGNPESLAMTVFGAAATGECGDLLKKWDNDQPATLGVNTPNGLVSQTLSWRDLTATELPMQQPPTASRERQCSGWVLQTFFDMCVDGQLDPIYR